MYSLTKDSDTEYTIRLGSGRKVGVAIYDGEKWHGQVRKMSGEIVMEYESTNRRAAVEGLLKEMLVLKYEELRD